MTRKEALSLARNLIYGPIPAPTDPTPTVKEAVRVITEERRTCGFNWITGTVALEALRKGFGK